LIPSRPRASVRGPAALDACDRRGAMRLAGRFQRYRLTRRPLMDPGIVQGVVIQPDRDALYARIERRFDVMIDAGALSRSPRHRARSLSPNLPAMKAVGLPPLLAHLSGELSLEAAIETRQTRLPPLRQAAIHLVLESAWRLAADHCA
jgi:tRNA dimethylallyltransferase